MKRKTLAVLLSTAMIAAVVSGCGGKKAETEAPATEKKTEAVTEKATEKTTEEATEAATEAATEEATEAATEKTTEAATEEATEAVTETETETEEATEAATEKTTEEATEAATEEATEEATEAATEEATEAAAETETETEEATEAVTETETETEEATEAVTETEAATEEATEAAAETETETEEATEAVTETETETEEATEVETETETETEEATEAVTETETETEEATEVETETETEEATEAETETETETEEATEVETDAFVQADVYEGEFTVGISQFAEHGSLDNCREGFLEGLAEEGFVEDENLTVLYDNAQADTGTASTIADSYVSSGVDLICAIATPSAMSAYNSAMDTEIPVVYTAVSDPVGAGLANEDGTPVGNITGTSDKLPVEEQLKMIREMMPDAEKIGIIYTTSEANSVSTIEEYKAAAPEYGFEIVESGINTLADVDLAAADIVGKVDCISNLTDNTVVQALQTVLAYANEAQIPVFGSEVEQVKNGCVASMGIDYVELGKQTGKMAAEVLKGETAESINFEICEGASLYVNLEAAANLSMDLDEAYIADAAEVFDTIEVE